MSTGIRIGKVFGIDIFIDWSWLLIFILVAWNLARGIFPAIHPNWSVGLTWTIGFGAAILFFVSVLAHELAHSIVAKYFNLPVRRITLFLFGGVSNITREPATPISEFLIAIVGPITSILIGLLSLIIGYAIGEVPVFTLLRNPTQSLAVTNPLATVFFWLGPVNIILGFFNLIPGFPLDGGRVLRSILWGATHNLRQATRWASWIGQLVAWAFIIAGIAMIFGVSIPVFGTGFISGLWLAFIGWFLNQSAIQSYQQLVIQDALVGIPVDRLMQHNPPAVPSNMLVSQLVDEYILGSDERSFIVMDGTQLIGMVSLNDVRKIPRQNWDHTTVSLILTPIGQIETITPKDDVSDAFDALNKRDVRQLPVIQDGNLVGIIRRRDIMRWLQLQADIHVGGIQP